MKAILFFIPLTLLLAGCQSTSTVLTNPIFQDRPKMTVSMPAPANQTTINWIVLTKENAAEKIAEIERKQGVVSVFALTPQSYQNLSVNVAELRRYIQQQNSTLAAVREYYETPVKVGDNKNGSK